MPAANPVIVQANVAEPVVPLSLTPVTVMLCPACLAAVSVPPDPDMDTLLRVEPAFDRGVVFPGAVSGAASATAQAKDNMVLMLCICETSRANLLGTYRAEDFGNAKP